MKKEKKWTPHFIAVTAFVVFIVLGLACASAPELWETEMLPMALTQTIMNLNDPRVPDLYDAEGVIYEYMTLSPEYSKDRLGFLLPQWVTGAVDIFIDGTEKLPPGTMFGLAPGKHTIRFSYSGTTYVAGKTQYYTIPNLSCEFIVESGNYYYIDYRLNTSGNALADHNMSMHGYTRYNVSINPRVVSFSEEMKIRFTSPPPALQVGKTKSTDKYIYLEPWDSTVPLESQSFLQIGGGRYIVGFDGNTVSWGAGSVGYERYYAFIGIPSGNHVLQILDLRDDNKLYTATIEALPQRRYNVYPDMVIDRSDKTTFKTRRNGRYRR